jgi:hypothetical protein
MFCHRNENQSCSLIVMPLLRQRNFLRNARQGAAALCLLIFLVLQAMATFPALHALVHHDSTDPSHNCAVTMFLQGQVHASSPAVNVVRSAPIFYTQPFVAAADFVAADVQLLPSCGPPAFLPVI